MISVVARPIFRSDIKLGSGGYGSVYTEYKNPSCAVKIYKDTLELHSSVIREVSSLVILGNKCRIPLIDGVCLEDEKHRFSMSISESSLAHLIGRYKVGEEVVKNMLLELLTILTTLSNFNISHRDVKPANILCDFGLNNSRLDKVSNFKLCDFGLARFVNLTSREFLTNSIQTPGYKSPEVLLKKGYILDRVDIWSLGIMAIELLTGSVCISAENSLDHIQSISKKFGTPDLKGSEFEGQVQDIPRPQPLLKIAASNELQEIINLMTQTDPLKRPTAFELLRMPYFNRPVNELGNLEKLGQISRLYPLDVQKCLSYGDRPLIISEIIESYDTEIFVNPETLSSAILFVDLMISRDLCAEAHVFAAACVSLSYKVHEHSAISTEVLAEHLDVDYTITIGLEKEIFRRLGYMLFIPSYFTYLDAKEEIDIKNIMHMKSLISSLKSGDYLKTDYVTYYQ